MKFLDFFSGIGGFRLGFELAGHECVGHVEWDKYAQQSYKAMYSKGREKEYEKEFCGWDITEVRADQLPRADVWNFGAPCQDFSMAGKRAGLGGERSSLVHEVFRLVRETPEADRPTWLIYENVKGLLSSNGGRDFLAIITEMAELGYDVEWQLFNSKNYGVPQNRERVYTIGHLRGRSGGKILPITGTDGQASVPIKIVAHRNGYRRNMQTFSPEGITEALDTGQGGGRGHHVIESRACITPDRVNKRQNGRRFKEPGEPMFTLTAQDIHGVAIREATKQGYAIAEPGDPINLEHPNSKTRRGRVGKEVAQTLTTSCNQAVIEPTIIDDTYKNREPREYTDYSPTLRSERSGLKVNNGIRIRKLTPKECWRLQGFPDEYFHRAKSSGVSDSQLYKQAGNSVTVSVVYEIARRLKK